MNEPPLARQPAKHFLQLSDEDEDEEQQYNHSYKRQKGNASVPKMEMGKGKGKGKQAEKEPTGGDEGDGEKEEWYYCNSEGQLVIMDSPKPKSHSNEASGSNARIATPNRTAHQSGQHGGRGGHLAFAGGSSKAAQAEIDPLDEMVATVCSIIPDVVPTYVRDLLRQPQFETVELVVEALLTDASYPRRETPEITRVMEKPEESDEDDQQALRKEANTWMGIEDRVAKGKSYENAALAQLYCDFPSIQQVNIKRIFAENSNFYAPTYVAAKQLLTLSEEERGFKLMTTSKARAGKGKGKEDEDLEREKKWITENFVRLQDVELREKLLAKQLEEEIASGSYFECGCCYGDTGFSQLVICSEGCQFCRDCAIMNAETQIGMRKFVLPCMSTSGCASSFPEVEIAKFLSRKSREALHKIRQEKEIDLAELSGLEKCPFCPFALIIENDQERLFHCQREECRVVSCRQCKKKDHLPKTCLEVSEDSKINAVHQVEEAMSRALIRKCPKCSEPYIKEADSCNKIVCSSCRTLSCYVCGKIVAGYEHFANAGSNAPKGSEPGAVCPLWEDTGARHYEEVEAARLQAERIAREHPGITEEELSKLRMQAPGPPPARLAHFARPIVPVPQQNGLRQLDVPAPAPAQPPAPRQIAQIPIRPPNPPPIPTVTPLRPEVGYTRSQVVAMYQTAYNSLYSNVADYAPWLDQWARDAANRKFTEWYAANSRHEQQQQQQQRRDREEQRAIQTAAARARARARQEADSRARRVAEEAREARRRRTQGKS